MLWPRLHLPLVVQFSFTFILYTTPNQNCLGGQKLPRKVPKPPKKWSLAASRQAKSAKNREPRKFNFLGCQPSWIIFLAVWPQSKVGQHPNCNCTNKLLQPPRIQLSLAVVDSQEYGFSWRSSTAKNTTFLGGHWQPRKIFSLTGLNVSLAANRQENA